MWGLWAQVIARVILLWVERWLDNDISVRATKQELIKEGKHEIREAFKTKDRARLHHYLLRARRV